MLLSRLILVMGAAPIVAPTLGGALLGVTTWRGVFDALALYGLALLPVAARMLPETLPPHRRRPAQVGATSRTYRGMFAYVAGSSFVFQKQFGLGEQGFGLLFGVGAVFIIGATQVNAYLLRRFESHQLLLAAVLAATAAGLLLFAASLTGFGGLTGVFIPLWAALFAAGLALPNTPALALSRHGEAAGTAAALLGAIQFGTGTLVSPLVGVVGNDATAMGAVVATAMALALALTVLVLVVRPWQLADLDVPALALTR